MQLEVARAVPEVRERGLLDAVGAVAEVDRVQVRLEDPALRPALRELPRERRLAHLAGNRLLVAVERVLDELLRDRGATLDDLLLADVRPERAPDPADVDAAVLPVAPVLDRDDRMAHPRIDLVEADESSGLGAAEDGEDARRPARALARRGVDVAVDLLLELPAGIELRQLAGDRRDQPEAERDRAEKREDGEEREEPELADPPPPIRRAPAFGSNASGEV